MYKNGSGNSEGVGGYFSGQKMEILGRRGGLCKIPSVVGVWIFSGTTQCLVHILHPSHCFSIHGLQKVYFEVNNEQV